MMAEAAQILDPGPAPRRFQVPDLDRCQKWLLPRLRTAYPHVQEGVMIGWLRGIIYQNEFLFLMQDNSVGCFQISRGHTLSPQAVIMEHFVWCEDKDNALHHLQAARFYDEAKTWATHQGATTILVEVNSDVPHEMIREKLGRLFTRQEIFARL